MFPIATLASLTEKELSRMLDDRTQRRLERLLDQAEESADQENRADVPRFARQALRIDSENVDAANLISLA